MTQLVLLEPRPVPRRCRLCGARAPKRCRWCDKRDLPRPCTPPWRRWTRGLGRTLRRRLDDAGLGRLAIDALKALLFDQGTCPPEAAPLLADIAALPCSLGRYNEVLERALNAEGLSMYTAEERRRRNRIPDLRVAELPAQHVRIEVGDEEAAAEHEAAAVEATTAVEGRA